MATAPVNGSTEHARAGDEPVLDFHDVEKTFRAGGRSIGALNRFSFQVKRSSVTGLVGPDGAGKTTAMRLATGLLLPDAGRIRVLGRDVTTDAAAVQEATGYMPQRFGLYEDLTVLENLELYADLQGQPKSVRPDRYRELMKMTALDPFLDRLAGRLSGGMKQKLGLACTLVRPPRLLLLDEPTAGVDPISRRELWNIIDRAVQEEGMSVLLSTAYLDEAERCDHVVVLHEGDVLGSGPPDSFSAPLRGRTFVVTAPSLSPRALQDRLADAEGVTDAVVQGRRVRLTMDEGCEPNAAVLLPGVSEVDIEPVEPRFEDGFVTMLRPRVAPSRAKANSAATEPPSAHRVRRDDSIIKVDSVTRRFGQFEAVRGISFDVRQGEVFGLLGANGAGKSTTFRMLCGVLPPSAGRLRVAGVDVRHAASAARTRMGYVSQKFSLYGILSVRQNLQFFSAAYGLSGRRRAARVRWAMDQFGLDAWSEAASENLPLGYQKRLAMACSLVHDPDVLFLDEPTSGVDPLARRDFWREIQALSVQGVTILVTTHFMEEAEYCDRLAIMAAGQILQQGTAEEIRNAAPRRDGKEPTIEDAFIRLIEDATPEERGP